MKAMRLLPFALAGLLPVVLSAGEVRVGDTADAVRSALGAPRGQAEVAGRRVLYYDRGAVELNAGAVTRVALLSDEELAGREARRAAEAERLRVRIAEGEALKASRLADAGFRSAPPAYQLEYWENFIRRYPGVPCADQLALARALLAEQLAERNARFEAARIAAGMEARAGEEPVMIYGGGCFHGYRHWRSAGLGPFDYHFDTKPVALIAGPVIPPVFNSGSRDDQADARWNRPVRPGFTRGPGDRPAPFDRYGRM